MFGSISTPELTPQLDNSSVICTQEVDDSQSIVEDEAENPKPDEEVVQELDEEVNPMTMRVTTRSWMIREILDTIFSFLIPQYDLLREAVLQRKPYSSSQNRATLFSAVLTCRTMSEAAQAALWNTMDSFGPIIPLLPLVRTRERYSFTDASIDQSRRLKHYLSRIKTFILDRTEDSMADFSVQMAFTSIGSVLFPGLGKLIVPNFAKGLTQEQRMLLPCLLASPVKDVVIGGITDSQSFEALASALACRASDSLESISCSWKHLPRTITSLPSLHTVILTEKLSNQPSIIADLSTCPSLLRLELSLSRERPNSSRVDESPFFDRLEHLSLSGKFSVITSFLKLFTSPNLHTLRLQPELRNGEAETLARHFRTLSAVLEQHDKKYGYDRLETLEIDYTKRLPKAYSPEPSSYRVFFQSLSAFPLRSVILAWPALLPSEISLRYITSCLPNLHTLYLPKYQENEGPTFEDLHSLARTAPKLRHLGTRIRTGRIETAWRASEHFLDTLCVYDSKVENTLYVTEELDQSFPYLRKITSNSVLAGCEAGWKEVEILLGLCQRSRRRF